MKSFRIEDHVADVRARAIGDTLEELFRASLEAMTEISRKNGAGGKSPDQVRESLELTAPDTTVLLIDFLSEALTRGHLDQALYYDVEFDTLSENHLRATLQGARVDHLDKDIKAVTYHEAEVHRNTEGRFETTIVFDI
jgi:SHS2 domain-containing protein